ncbi:MAG: hypothetical protein IJM59_05270 [Proteobacteria bacterium]|nr:hypothetical protein [Pseudomonadota bacterium]
MMNFHNTLILIICTLFSICISGCDTNAARKSEGAPGQNQVQQTPDTQSLELLSNTDAGADTQAFEHFLKDSDNRFPVLDEAGFVKDEAGLNDSRLEKLLPIPSDLEDFCSKAHNICKVDNNKCQDLYLSIAKKIIRTNIINYRVNATFLFSDINIYEKALFMLTASVSDTKNIYVQTSARSRYLEYLPYMLHFPNEIIDIYSDALTNAIKAKSEAILDEEISSKSQQLFSKLVKEPDITPPVLKDLIRHGVPLDAEFLVYYYTYINAVINLYGDKVFSNKELIIDWPKGISPNPPPTKLTMKQFEEQSAKIKRIIKMFSAITLDCYDESIFNN